MPIIDWGRKSKNKSFNGLEKLIYKFSKSITKTNSKVYKFLIYNMIINNLIHEIK